MSIELEDFVRTMKKIGDLASPSLKDHEVRTQEMSLKIGARLNLLPDRLKLLGQGAVIHDFGKLVIDQYVLGKSEKLNKSDMEMVRSHVKRGIECFELLPEDSFPIEIRQIIIYHHEHFDGNGYPERRKGLDIPLFARIVCIPDVWDALSNDRPYRAALSFEKALKEMKRCSAWFDPELFNIFLSIIENEHG